MKTTHSKNMKNLLIHGLCMMVVTGLHAAEPAKSSSKGSDQKLESVLEGQPANKSSEEGKTVDAEIFAGQIKTGKTDSPAILAAIKSGEQVEVLTQDQMASVRGEFFFLGPPTAGQLLRGEAVKGVIRGAKYSVKNGEMSPIKSDKDIGKNLQKGLKLTPEQRKRMKTF